MDIQSVRDQLHRLGLDEDRSDAYLVLLLQGPMKASEVASRTGISRSHTYRVLGRLQEDGWVEVSMGQPAVYTATDPENVFARALQEARGEVVRLEGIRGSVEEAMRNLRRSPEEPGVPCWQVIDGRPQGIRRMARMLSGAREEVLYASNHAITFNLVPEVERVWERAMDLAAAGVSVRTLLAPPEKDWDRFAAHLDHDGIQARRLHVDHPLQVLVVDQREVLTVVTRVPSVRLNAQGVVSLWSDAPGLVQNHATLLDLLWEKGEVLPT